MVRWILSVYCLGHADAFGGMPHLLLRRSSNKAVSNQSPLCQSCLGGLLQAINFLEVGGKADVCKGMPKTYKSCLSNAGASASGEGKVQDTYLSQSLFPRVCHPQML